MQFFRYFEQIPYAFFPDATGLPTTITLTNITDHVIIKERLQQNIRVFYDYLVQDGERPDTVADKVYGSVNYTWVVLLVNNIFSLFDWPLTHDEFNDYIVEKYGSVAAAQAVTVYRTVDNYKVDALTYATLAASQQGVNISAFDDEFTANEVKRHIKVIPVAFVLALTNELKRLF